MTSDIGILAPSPIVTCRHQRISFLFTAFLGSPIPHPVRRSYKYGPNPFSAAALIALRSFFEWVGRGPLRSRITIHTGGRRTHSRRPSVSCERCAHKKALEIGFNRGIEYATPSSNFFNLKRQTEIQQFPEIGMQKSSNFAASNTSRMTTYSIQL